MRGIAIPLALLVAIVAVPPAHASERHIVWQRTLHADLANGGELDVDLPALVDGALTICRGEGPCPGVDPIPGVVKASVLDGTTEEICLASPVGSGGPCRVVSAAPTVLSITWALQGPGAVTLTLTDA